MANGYQGLASGIERGFRLGAMLEDRGHQQEMRALEKQLTEMQIQTLKDDKKREDLRRSNDAFLYSLKQFQTDPQGYSAYLENNPREKRRLHDHIKRVGDFAFADSGKAGKTKTIDLVPEGVDDQGSPLFGVSVTTESGEQSRITNNRGKMADGDQATLFSIDELGSNSALLRSLIHNVESQQIQLGDRSPLENARAAEAERAKRAYEERQSDKEFQQQVLLKGIGRKPQKIGTDVNTGMDKFGFYDPETNTFQPVGEQSPGFSGLPPEQQRAHAIETLKEAGVTPQESTYFGLGDPEYSDQQIDAQIARLSLSGVPSQPSSQGLSQGGISPPTTLRKQGETWVNSKGQTVQATEEGPKVLGISSTVESQVQQMDIPPELQRAVEKLRNLPSQYDGKIRGYKQREKEYGPALKALEAEVDRLRRIIPRAGGDARVALEQQAETIEAFLSNYR